jgi:hypothetical protein
MRSLSVSGRHDRAELERKATAWLVRRATVD